VIAPSWPSFEGRVDSLPRNRALEPHGAGGSCGGRRPTHVTTFGRSSQANLADRGDRQVALGFDAH
jgi:hypothetical protein